MNRLQAFKPLFSPRFKLGMALCALVSYLFLLFHAATPHWEPGHSPDGLRLASSQTLLLLEASENDTSDCSVCQHAGGLFQSPFVLSSLLPALSFVHAEGWLRPAVWVSESFLCQSSRAPPICRSLNA